MVFIKVLVLLGICIQLVLHVVLWNIMIIMLSALTAILWDLDSHLDRHGTKGLHLSCATVGSQSMDSTC